MSFFLYYAPGRSGLFSTPEVYRAALDELGLAGVLAGTTCESRRVEQEGPDGGAGVVFVPHVATSPCGGERLCGVYKERQTWYPGPKDDDGVARYWIGHFNDAAPGPGDLDRGVAIASTAFRMADGEEWQIPIAQGLPQRRTLTPEGEDALVPRTEHVGFHAQAMAFLETVVPHSADLTQMPDPALAELWALASSALGLLYRVGELECKVLGLFEVGGEASLFRVCLESIGYSVVMADVAALEDDEAEAGDEKKSE